MVPFPISLPALPHFSRPCAAALCLSLLAALAPAQSIHFREYPTLPASVYPTKLAVADFNGDQINDIVVVNEGNYPFTEPYIRGSISIYMGLGDMQFEPPRVLIGSIKASGVVADDFDRDGNMDIAATNYVDYNNVPDPGDLYIMYGRGDGTFRTVFRTPSPGGPTDITSTDLNGDDYPELIVTHETVNSVVTLMNDGSGTFTAFTQYATADKPTMSVIADINQDDLMDLVVGHERASLTFWIGDGTGAFTTRTQLAVGIYADSLIATDLNNDGIVDLAVAGNPSPNVLVRYGLAGGGYQELSSHRAGLQLMDIVGFDFNRDGFMDLATANLHTNDVSILLGNANGKFLQTYRYSVGYAPRGLALAGMNGDGEPDLIVANSLRYFDLTYLQGSISILVSNGDGSFQGRPSNEAWIRPLLIQAGHVDNDPYLDIVVIDEDYQIGPSALLGHGDLTFTSGLPSGGSSPESTDLTLGD